MNILFSDLAFIFSHFLFVAAGLFFSHLTVIFILTSTWIVDSEHKQKKNNPNWDSLPT